jgi:hypothetical protein
MDCGGYDTQDKANLCGCHDKKGLRKKAKDGF